MKDVRPLLTIPDEAKDALAGPMPERAKKTINPRAQAAIAKAVNDQIRFRLFGPRMQPTMKERLLMWTSFRALMTGYRGA